MISKDCLCSFWASKNQAHVAFDHNSLLKVSDFTWIIYKTRRLPRRGTEQANKQKIYQKKIKVTKIMYSPAIGFILAVGGSVVILSAVACCFDADA